MKVLLFLFFSLITIFSFGQDYLNSSCRWSTHTTLCVDFICIEELYDDIIEGDTTINNQLYYKLYKRGTTHSYAWSTPTDTLNFNEIDSYSGALRAAENKWYWITKNTTNEFLLYDFNISPGDSITLGGSNLKFILTIVDSIYHDDAHKKIYQLGTTPFQLIEGVGFNTGLSISLAQIIESNFELFSYLNCFAKDHEPLAPDLKVLEDAFNIELLEACADFSNKTIIPFALNPSIFPNPFSNTIHLEFKNPVDGIAIYDMMGRQLLEYNPTDLQMDLHLGHLPDGLYMIAIQVNDQLHFQKKMKIK